MQPVETTSISTGNSPENESGAESGDSHHDWCCEQHEAERIDGRIYPYIAAAHLRDNSVMVTRAEMMHPIVFVLNNSGYLSERMLCKDMALAYNDIAAWNYAELPHAMG